MLSAFEKTAALRRTVTIEDVGNSAAFLCSDLASGITGEIVHVDAGFSITAMGRIRRRINFSYNLFFRQAFSVCLFSFFEYNYVPR